jgi:divalent metal cation (Fe/Co/Zn/Cd) transporter
LLADAGHSAADILSDILTLSTITFSTKDPTLRYPLGFGKVETLGAIGVSSLLRGQCKMRLMTVLGGIGIGLSSLDQLLQTLPPDALPPVLEELIHVGHSHGHSHGAVAGADPLALWVAGASVGIKEWLFRATKRIAVETNSTVLLANVSPIIILM